ncbi:hypothetical protein AVEN_111870-1, partial [Araneus ventricosus]
MGINVSNLFTIQYTYLKIKAYKLSSDFLNRKFPFLNEISLSNRGLGQVHLPVPWLPVNSVVQYCVNSDTYV